MNARSLLRPVLITLITMAIVYRVETLRELVTDDTGFFG